MESSRSIRKTCWSLRIIALVPALTAAAVVSGCSSVGGDAGALITLAREGWSRTGNIQLDEAAAVPYASLGVRVGSSNQIMLILASNDNGKMLWTSSSRIVLITRNGRIVGAAGLGHNLTATVPQEGVGAQVAKAVTWQADYPELGLYAVPITCETQAGGDETVTILGKAIQTRRIDERCHSGSDRLSWTFKNTYWVDPDSSLVWRSRQHINPKLDVIETEVLRPPG